MDHIRNVIGIFVLAIAVSSSCTDGATGPVVQRVAVDVIESVFPTEAQVNEVIEIAVVAQAPNGCYSDLKISLTETGESKHFLITATGLFVSRGVCPDVLVSEDSVISFKPETAGEYKFQVNEAPFKVREYSINVN